MPWETLTGVVRWQDIIDILLNAYILFRLYVLFRGTQVMRVAAGLAFLWLFQRVAAGMGLIVTSWAMQGIIAAAALIIIIVFRNEIRSVLQAQNLKAVLWGVPRKGAASPVDVLAESVGELSRRRTGALIVLPGKEDLKDLIHGGIEWQGLISREMLLSIFWSGNPVHDGAAVVEGARISRVGAILPLSQRQDLPHRFGTRHRAALGLAQSTDALVIVVSEETGNIVLARGHEIIDIHDRQVLRHQLRRHLGIVPEPSSRRKRQAAELAAAAVVCLVCVTAIWFSFTRGMETLTTVEVPVEFINRSAGLEIFDTSASMVRLYLSGSGPLIQNMRPDQLKVAVDLGEAESGGNTFHLGSSSVRLPPGIRLSRIEPAELTVTLDRIAYRRIPVQVNWMGRLSGDKRLAAAVLSPETIRLAGASRRLDAIDTIYTEPVDLGKLEKSGKIAARLLLEPPFLEVAGDAGGRIEVEYTIEDRTPL